LHFRKIEVVSYVIHKELCFGIVSLFVQDDNKVYRTKNWTKFLVVLDLYSLVLFFRHLFFSINSSPANLVYLLKIKKPCIYKDKPFWKSLILSRIKHKAEKGLF
jgi:hypothetical protein